MERTELSIDSTLSEPRPAVQGTGMHFLVRRFLEDGGMRAGIVNQVLDSWLSQPVGTNRGEAEVLAALIQSSIESPARLMLIDDIVSSKLVHLLCIGSWAAVVVAANYLDHIHPHGQSLASGLSSALSAIPDPTTLHKMIAALAAQCPQAGLALIPSVIAQVRCIPTPTLSHCRSLCCPVDEVLDPAQRTQDLRDGGDDRASRMRWTARCLDDITTLTPMMSTSPYREACVHAFAS
jgi:hypothetical protein